MTCLTAEEKEQSLRIGTVRQRPRPQLTCDTWSVEAKLSGGAFFHQKERQDAVKFLYDERWARMLLYLNKKKKL